METKRLVGILALAVTLVTPACRVATVNEPCVDDPGSCPACAGHDECSFQGNPCTESVYCAHVDAGLSFVDLGCDEAYEYAWPPDDECRCFEGICRWDD